MNAQLPLKRSRTAMLPFELLSKIIYTLVADPASETNRLLVVLSRTTRTFQNISEAIIYHNLEISLGSPQAAWNIVHALNNGPHRTAYIRRLYIHCLDGSVNENIVEPSFYAFLANSLSTITNLAHLSILDVPSQCSPTLLRALSRSPQQRLHTFVSNTLPSPALAEFLTTNRNIRTLILPYGSAVANPSLDLDAFSPPFLPHDALPHLEVIAARTNVVQRIVPQRPLNVVVVDYSVDANIGVDEYGDITYDNLLRAIGESSAINGVHTLSLHVRRAPGANASFAGEPAFPLFNLNKGLEAAGNCVRTLNVYSSKKITEIAPTLSNLTSAFPNAQTIQIDCLTFPWWSETNKFLAEIASSLANNESDTTPGPLQHIRFRDCGFSRVLNTFVWDAACGCMRRVEPEDGSADSQAARWSKDKAGNVKRVVSVLQDEAEELNEQEDLELFRRLLARGLIWQ